MGDFFKRSGNDRGVFPDTPIEEQNSLFTNDDQTKPCSLINGFAENSDSSVTITVPCGTTQPFPNTDVTVKDEFGNTLAIESLASGNPAIINVFITPVYHPQTIDYLTAAGIPNDGTLYTTPTTPITGADIWTAVEAFVSTNIDAGILQKMIATYLFIGGTDIAHKWNLIDITKFAITWYGGMAHNEVGPIFNGINSFADTGAIDGIDFCLGANTNSVSIGYYSQVPNPTNPVAHPFGTGMLGSTSDGCLFQAANSIVVPSYFCMRGATFNTISIGSQLGYNGFGRGSSFSQNCYEHDSGNNSEFNMPADVSIPLRYMVIGGVNGGATPLFSVSGYYNGPISGYYISEYLTYSEHIAFAQSWQDLQTALNRNV